jgi:hypothetical protein
MRWLDSLPKFVATDLVIDIIRSNRKIHPNQVLKELSYLMVRHGPYGGYVNRVGADKNLPLINTYLKANGFDETESVMLHFNYCKPV